MTRGTSSISIRLMAAGLAAGALLTGCAYLEQTRVEVGPGPPPRMTPGEIEAFVRAEVASMEANVGRVLTPLRIRRIRLLRPGDQVAAPKSDGTNPADRVMAATDRPLRMVEADGTFHAGRGQVLAKHAYFMIDDIPNPSWSLEVDPCWAPNREPDDDRFDGECGPP
jgi:hypothetical protein